MSKASLKKSISESKRNFKEEIYAAGRKISAVLDASSVNQRHEKAIQKHPSKQK